MSKSLVLVQKIGHKTYNYCTLQSVGIEKKSMNVYHLENDAYNISNCLVFFCDLSLYSYAPTSSI